MPIDPIIHFMIGIYIIKLLEAEEPWHENMAKHLFEWS